MKVTFSSVVLAVLITGAQATTLSSSLPGGTGYSSYSAGTESGTIIQPSASAVPSPYSCIVLPSPYSSSNAGVNHTYATTSSPGLAGSPTATHTVSHSHHNENWGKSSSPPSNSNGASTTWNGNYTTTYATAYPTGVPICPPGYNVSISASSSAYATTFIGNSTANATSTVPPSGGATPSSQNLKGDNNNLNGSAVSSMKLSFSVVALGGIAAVASML